MRRRLLAKLLLCAALCVLVIAVTVWLTKPTPLLRNGMSRAEVHGALGLPNKSDMLVVDYYYNVRDASGNTSDIRVCYDANEKVTEWRIDPFDPPSLLQRITKALGW
jgi:hypothetical protein